MSEFVDPPRCEAQHPTWRDPIARCVRPPGHDGKHGHAGVFWADEPRMKQRIVIPGGPGVQIDVDSNEFTVTIDGGQPGYTCRWPEGAKIAERPNFDRFVPRGPTRDDLLDAWIAYRAQPRHGVVLQAERRAFEAGWHAHQRQTGGGVV